MAQSREERLRNKREYYYKHKDKIRKYFKEYYKSNKKKIVLKAIEWTNKNRARIAINHRINENKMRLKVIDMLGGECIKCGYSKDWRALQIDHVNGGGTKDRKNHKGTINRMTFRRLLAGDTRYQLLCANCNWIKKYENNENHPRKYEYGSL